MALLAEVAATEMLGSARAPGEGPVVVTDLQVTYLVLGRYRAHRHPVADAGRRRPVGRRAGGGRAGRPGGGGQVDHRGQRGSDAGPVDPRWRWCDDLPTEEDAVDHRHVVADYLRLERWEIEPAPGSGDPSAIGGRVPVDPRPARCRRRPAHRRVGGLHRLAGWFPVRHFGAPRLGGHHLGDDHRRPPLPSGTAPTGWSGPAARTQLGGGCPRRDRRRKRRSGGGCGHHDLRSARPGRQESPRRAPVHRSDGPGRPRGAGRPRSSSASKPVAVR